MGMDWTPATTEPIEDGNYLVTVENHGERWVREARWWYTKESAHEHGQFDRGWDGGCLQYDVVAWIKIPGPYNSDICELERMFSA